MQVLQNDRVRVIWEFIRSFILFFMVPSYLIHVVKTEIIPISNQYVFNTMLIIILVLPFVYLFLEILTRIKRLTLSNQKMKSMGGIIYYLILFIGYLTILFYYL
jgi:hypothetical protein